MHPPTSLLVSLLLLAACGSTRSESLGITIRDSAGVRIVEYPRDAVASASTWHANEIITTLGGIDADESTDATNAYFGNLVDGGFVVVDIRTLHLRLFTDSGTLVATGGGRGEGPGELSSIWRIFRTEVGIAAYDWPRGELTLYDDSLRYTQELTLRDVVSGAVVSYDSDGTVYRIAASETGAFHTTSTDIVRAPQYMVRTRATGGPTDTLFQVLGAESYALGSGSRARRFSLMPLIKRSSTGYLSSDGERWEVVSRDHDGNIHGYLRLDWPRRAVTEEMRQERLRLDRAEIDELPPGGFVGIRRMAQLDFADPRFPDSLPPFEQSILGRDGTLWLREGQAPTDSLQRWLIFLADSLIGRLELPADVEVHDADTGRMLLRRTDSLDIGYLELRRVDRKPS